MKITQSILTKNPCYVAGKKITVKGLMLHSVGCPQPSASVFVKNWNDAKYNRACVHAFIDGNNGRVYQTLPWNHRGWHCGGSANNTHIGVEMCEPSNIKYVGGTTITCTDKVKARAVVQRTYDNAVALFAHLCKIYKLDPMTDIISHKEGATKGVASKHSDPEHLWKQLGMGYTMNTFRKAVKVAMKKDVPYMVKITASTLNVRKGAGVTHPIATTVNKGEIYTIVDESNGWGKLKSGAGWISLNYSKRI
jgi:N-acetylmuramoyl-L-alanine amidase CwlA